MIKVAGLFPAGALSGVTAETYETVFGNMTAFVIASLAAYLVAQNVDVLIFHGIRDAYIKKHGSIKGGRWIWNNGSTIVSQLIDSAVFGVIAYGFGLHLPADAIVMSVIAQWLFKAIIAVCDTPIFYACTSLLRKVKPEENA